MAYFDNAATTFPKPDCVYSFMEKFYRTSGGNSGRGIYALADVSKKMIDETRNLLKQLFHCGSKQVIFTPSATIALNKIIQGIIFSGAKNIYISPFEHNAVTRTLNHFERLGKISVTELSVTNEFEFDFTKIRKQFEQIHPDFVIISHASNVMGLIAPVEEIFSMAKIYDATTLVDMAQTAGLVELNVGLETIDFAVFAGHKTLFAPTGVGGFVMKPTIQIEPVIFGGTGYDSANQDMPATLPERFEPGTLNVIGIAGLNAALKWIQYQTTEKIFAAEEIRRQQLLELFADYDFLHVVGNISDKNYVGIVSCLIKGISSDDAGNIFSERGISVRTGLHCAPIAHKFLGTFPAGTIRFSVNCMTSNKDFAELRDVLEEIKFEL